MHVEKRERCTLATGCPSQTKGTFKLDLPLLFGSRVHYSQQNIFKFPMVFEEET